MDLRQNKTALFQIGAMIAAIITLSALMVRTGSSDFAGLLILAGGCALYLTLAKLHTVDRRMHLDYLQSGEGPIATIAACSTAVFLAANLYAVLASVVASLIVYNLCRDYFSLPHHREQRMIGLIAFAVSIPFFAFLLTGAGFNAATIADALPARGVPRLLSGHLYLVPVFMLLSASALYLLSQSMDEIAAYAQGPAFFELTGIRFAPVAYLLLLVKSVFTAIVFICLGWAGGIGVYLQLKIGPASLIADIKLGLILLIYAQLITLAVQAIGPIGAIAISALLSYAAYYRIVVKGEPS